MVLAQRPAQSTAGDTMTSRLLDIAVIATLVLAALVKRVRRVRV